MKKNYAHGFTLVELSIVLVIIGLLTGGILAGKSLIKSSRVMSITKQISQFDAVVNAYYSINNGLPGDMMPSVGNKNGVIECDSGYQCYDYISFEATYFWNDLSAVDFTMPSGAAYSGDYAADFKDKYPQAAMGNNAYVVGYGSNDTKENYYYIGGLSSSSYGQVTLMPAFKDSDVSAIDSKIDDGKPTAGNIMAIETINNGFPVYPTTNVASYNECGTWGGSDYIYDNTHTQPGCSIRVRMGASSGTAR